MKFCTGFGRHSILAQDVSNLAPLLKGECTIKGFVDTWVSPTWKMSFKLIYEDMAESENPSWAKGVFYTDALIRNNVIDKEPSVNLFIPEDREKRIELLDNFGYYVPLTDIDLEISSPDSFTLFFADQGNWANSIIINIKHNSAQIWAKSSVPGDFTVNVEEVNTSNGLPELAPLIISVFDLEVGENDINYFLMATAQADCEFNRQTETAFHAIDGNIATKWCYNNGSPDWLEVTLSDTTELNYFIIRHTSAGQVPVGDPGYGDNSCMNSQNFKIQIENTAGEFEDVIVVTDNPAAPDGDVSYHFLEQQVKTKKVRLYLTKPDVSRIYEFKMYNLRVETAIADLAFGDCNSTGVTQKFQLFQNYPNPFNHSTQISFFISEYSDVSAMIFNIKGRMIAQSVTGHFPAGFHKTNWEAKDLNGISVPSSVYFLNVKYKNQKGSSVIKVKKMVYLR